MKKEDLKNKLDNYRKTKIYSGPLGAIQKFKEPGYRYHVSYEPDIIEHNVAIGWEIVQDSEGKTVRVKGNGVLIRMPKELYVEIQKVKEEDNIEIDRSMDPNIDPDLKNDRDMYGSITRS